MYLALNGVLVGGRVPWPEFAQLGAKLGYKGVDVMLAPVLKAGLKPTKALLEELHIRPAVTDLPVEFRKDEATFRASLPKLEEAAPFMTALGCPRMITWIMSSSDTPKDELRRTYKKRFTDCAHILARSHGRLGLEFLGPLHLRRAA